MKIKRAPGVKNKIAIHAAIVYNSLGGSPLGRSRITKDRVQSMNTYNENRYKTMRDEYSRMAVAVPPDSERITRESGALFTFAAWGDPQIFHGSSSRTQRFAFACADVAAMEGKLDAVAILGDIAEMGAECEYRMCADLLSGITDKFDDLLCVPGNHDIRIRDYKKQRDKFRDFVLSVKGGVFDNENGGYYFSRDYDCCKFIMMGSDMNSFEGTYISGKQQKWLDAEIGRAEAEGKTAFVLNHQTLKHSNGLPVTWGGNGKWRGSIGFQSDRIQDIFEKHRNVVFITGHLHYGFSVYNYEDCGCYKLLSLPTVGVINHGPMCKDSQGYIVSVFPDKITIRARLHMEGRWLNPKAPGAYIEIKRNPADGSVV